MRQLEAATASTAALFRRPGRRRQLARTAAGSGTPRWQVLACFGRRGGGGECAAPGEGSRRVQPAGHMAAHVLHRSAQPSLPAWAVATGCGSPHRRPRPSLCRPACSQCWSALQSSSSLWQVRVFYLDSGEFQRRQRVLARRPAAGALSPPCSCTLADGRPPSLSPPPSPSPLHIALPFTPYPQQPQPPPGTTLPQRSR